MEPELAPPLITVKNYYHIRIKMSMASLKELSEK